MKKILFIIRDSFDAKFIISEINKIQCNYQIFYLLESGKIAQKKKIKIMIKKNGPRAVINMVALVLYDTIMKRYMKTILCKDYSYPSGNQYYHINDVNEEKCIQISNSIEPDLIMVYGSGIIKRKTIDMLKADIYNIHSSVLPYYRNVHSDFWAYMHRDFDKIGITIFKLNEGIDMGNIASQQISDLKMGSKLEEYKVENLRIIIRLLDRFWKCYFANEISLIEQDNSVGTTASTPTTKDLFLYYKLQRGTDN